MELRHLRYFVKVAGELHFGRAADQLGISQPPLSQQIRQLEQELGVTLFERSSRRVRLTVAGRLFLEEARATLAQADHAVSTARRAAIGEVGELSFGLSASSLFVPAMSAAIADYRNTYPDVHLHLAEMHLAPQREALVAGTLDIGLVRSARRPAMPDGIDVSVLVVDRMCVAMPAGHRLAIADEPLSVAELAGEAMVHYPYDREGFTDDISRLFETVGTMPRIVQEAHEMSTMLGLVAAGIGITILPGPLRRLRVDNLHYRELSDASALTTMWLLHAIPRPTCAAFLRILSTHCEQQLNPEPSSG